MNLKNSRMIPQAPNSRQGIVDSRLSDIYQLLPPVALVEKFPATDFTDNLVKGTRKIFHDILCDSDDRLVVIAGPCSIHDPKAALDYAARLLELRKRYADQLEIIMRVYFEKPRTTIGWKGLINDPDLDGSYDINNGLRIARKLLRDLNEMGIPAATEYLDTISPQYIDEFISWGAIGARTTESQVHRELASGLSCPVGFKNATNGSVKIAMDAVIAAKHEHTFMSVTKFGYVAIVQTKGNEDCHIILRGGKEPNYKKADVDAACDMLVKAGLRPKVMIDFSHSNSLKQFKKQIDVGNDVAAQIAAGDNRIFGVMIESNLVEGNQPLSRNLDELEYGKSITDACVGFDDTVKIIETLNNAVLERRKVHQA